MITLLCADRKWVGGHLDVFPYVHVMAFDETARSSVDDRLHN